MWLARRCQCNGARCWRGCSSTPGNAINLAARILDDALAEDLVPKNYAALVRKDVPANPESIGTVLTLSQIRKLLTCAGHRYNEDGQPVCDKKQRLYNRFEALYWITVLLGLRKGEALGLHWSGIDFDGLTIEIDQQVQYIKGAPQIAPPKRQRHPENTPRPQSNKCGLLS